MLIRAIRAENFMRFSRIEIENLPSGGLVGIEGPNESGKTTLGELLLFAFFGRPRAVGVPCLLNGFPPLAASVLEERDEVIVGGEVLYFGAHGLAETERFVAEDAPVRCSRCKAEIKGGDEVARCPACRAVHHEGALAERPEEVRSCFSYFGEPCAACGRTIEEFRWSPKEVWE